MKPDLHGKVKDFADHALVNTARHPCMHEHGKKRATNGFHIHWLLPNAGEWKSDKSTNNRESPVPVAKYATQIGQLHRQGLLSFCLSLLPIFWTSSVAFIR